MEKTGINGVSHLGICVSNLERAITFYRDGLGFEEISSLELENQYGNVMGLADFKMSARFLSLGDIRIELLHYSRSEGAVSASGLRAMNHTGFTHLALLVDDVDAVAERIVEHGGRVFPDTRGTFAGPEGPIELLYCSDPDFTRIELTQNPT
jgi:lactoylglutathione lyase